MLGIHEQYSLSERLACAISSVRSLPGDTVESLICKGADVILPHDTLLPLHSACMVCDANCVVLLLDNGANVNAKGRYQRTALHYAAEKDEACVEMLLLYGANPNATDDNQITPLHRAAFRNMYSCLLVLLQTDDIKVNALDSNQDTLLSWAAVKGNIESIRFLLDYGALPDPANLKGQYPAGRLASLMGRGLGGEREEQCLELLHRACGTLRFRREGGVPPEAARDAQLCQRLLKLCSDPGSLKALARRVIRESLGECLISTAVTELPVPKAIQDYLLLVE